MSRWPFYLYCRQQGLWTHRVTGHDPQTDGAFLARYCPERLVTDRYPPTLLLHGNEDTDVPYERSVEMRAALDAAGVEVRLITIAGGGHGFEHWQAAKPEVQSAMDEVGAIPSLPPVALVIGRRQECASSREQRGFFPRASKAK